MSDEVAKLIEATRATHVDGINHVLSTWSPWCYVCQEDYPCLPARLAEALEGVQEERDSAYQLIARQINELSDARGELAAAQQWANHLGQDGLKAVGLLRESEEQLAAQRARAERLEAQVDEYHEWVEEALKELPDWMAPVGHAALAPQPAAAEGEG